MALAWFSVSPIEEPCKELRMYKVLRQVPEPGYPHFPVRYGLCRVQYIRDWMKWLDQHSHYRDVGVWINGHPGLMFTPRLVFQQYLSRNPSEMELAWAELFLKQPPGKPAILHDWWLVPCPVRFDREKVQPNMWQFMTTKRTRGYIHWLREGVWGHPNLAAGELMYEPDHELMWRHMDARKPPAWAAEMGLA